MDRMKTWALRLGVLGALGGAVLSRDACLGGSRPPPPDPPPTAPSAMTAEPQPAPPSAQPAPSGTFATPP